MGKLRVDSTVQADFDDRVLAHLQIVIGTKQRRGESFHFRWKDDDSVGDGHTIVWIHPRATISYKFYGGRVAQINHAWIEELMLTANTAAGLHLTPEPNAPGGPTPHPADSPPQKNARSNARLR